MSSSGITVHDICPKCYSYLGSNLFHCFKCGSDLACIMRYATEGNFLERDDIVTYVDILRKNTPNDKLWIWSECEPEEREEEPEDQSPAPRRTLRVNAGQHPNPHREPRSVLRDQYYFYEGLPDMQQLVKLARACFGDSDLFDARSLARQTHHAFKRLPRGVPPTWYRWNPWQRL